MTKITALLTAGLDALATRKGALLGAPAVIALAAALSLAGPGAAPAQTPASSANVNGPFTTEQAQAIRSIVKDYLINNPDVMLEVQQALETKMEALQAEKAKVAIKENASDLYKRPDAPFGGNAQGDVTVVEFFDYNCGYCKRGFGDVVKLLDKDTKVKLVLKELPILSKGSEEATRVALAARMQGKYWEVHRTMLESKAQANEAMALKVAEKVPGIDMARLKKDMESPEVKAEIQQVRDLAQKMGIQGTPHFLVGDKAIPGAPENLYDALNGLVADVRKSGCSVC